MSKFNTDVVYKVTKEAKGDSPEMGYLYLKNVPVTFAVVLAPKKKHKSEDVNYQVNAFVNKDTYEKIDAIGVNKVFAEVGVTKKTKGENRGQVKYPLDEHNSPYAGMFATQLTRETIKRDKKTGEIIKKFDPLKVMDVNGNPFTEEVGNGSICHLKIFCYRSDGMLNTQLDTVCVVNHVPFIRSGGDYFDEELGITVKSNTTQKATEAKPVPEQDGITEQGIHAPDDSEEPNIPF